MEDQAGSVDEQPEAVGEAAVADINRCYDDLADYYHLIFEDWETSMSRQAEALGAILQRETGELAGLTILDCASGIGTQALGLARLGCRVTACDISARAIARLEKEAALRSLTIPCATADMRDLALLPTGFRVVIAVDNALPHLETTQDLVNALIQVRSKLVPAGLFMASVRDYDAVLKQKPVSQGPAFYREAVGTRIVFQVWDWIDDRQYVFHLYLTIPEVQGFKTVHVSAKYRAFTRDELTSALSAAGFERVRWLSPEQSGFYQPVVIANAPGRQR